MKLGAYTYVYGIDIPILIYIKNKSVFCVSFKEEHLYFDSCNMNDEGFTCDKL